MEHGTEYHEARERLRMRFNDWYAVRCLGRDMEGDYNDEVCGLREPNDEEIQMEILRGDGPLIGEADVENQLVYYRRFWPLG